MEEDTLVKQLELEQELDKINNKIKERMKLYTIEEYIKKKEKLRLEYAQQANSTLSDFLKNEFENKISKLNYLLKLFDRLRKVFPCDEIDPGIELMVKIRKDNYI